MQKRLGVGQKWSSADRLAMQSSEIREAARRLSTTSTRNTQDPQELEKEKKRALDRDNAKWRRSLVKSLQNKAMSHYGSQKYDHLNK